MICITGAGGTVGSEVLRQLESTNAKFRAAYFSQDKADRARAAGIDAVVIDYNRPETLEGAFEGCDRLFLLGRTITHVYLPNSDLKAGMIAGADARRARGPVARPGALFPGGPRVRH